jgi:EpsI family protein
LLKFLKSPAARIVTALLILQTAFLYSAVRPEFIPPSRPLEGMPTTLGTWKLVQTGVIEQEVLDVLKADDILNRVYCDTATGDCKASGQAAFLFVAGFRTQRTGKAPHSPKNCLPGSGWVKISSGEIPIDVGRGTPISVNRYVVASGSERDMVLYWYQSRDRVVADEFEAKFWVMRDAIRLNRTDTALVRVIVPIGKQNEAQAEATATGFVKSFYSTLLEYLPS